MLRLEGNAKLHNFYHEPPKPTQYPHNIGPSNADKTRSRDVTHAVGGIYIYIYIYIYVCVCVCVCVRERVCVCVYVRESV